MTGYGFTAPLTVYTLNPASGAVIGAPVPIDPSATTKKSDGFTVLPNGNFLINTDDGSCTDNQFSHTTGLVIAATTITLPHTFCTGVTSDRRFLYFSADFNSITKTDLTGLVLTTQSLSGSEDLEDISTRHREIACLVVSPASRRRMSNDDANVLDSYNSGALTPYCTTWRKNI